MFVEQPGEDARLRLQRKESENQRMRQHIAALDNGTAITEAERVAFRQIDNVQRQMPLDHAAIMKYRAERPELFMTLPGDDECRRALGLAPANDAERVERLKARKHGQS